LAAQQALAERKETRGRLGGGGGGGGAGWRRPPHGAIQDVGVHTIEPRRRFGVVLFCLVVWEAGQSRRDCREALAAKGDTVRGESWQGVIQLTFSYQSACEWRFDMKNKTTIMTGRFCSVELPLVAVEIF
jgi:hypothetical protein